MARPPKAQESIDKDELEKLMKLYPTIKEASDWFDVSVSSLERYIKANFDLSFDGLRDKSFTRTRIAIKKAQIEKALKGDNTMLIWCGKQYLGQRDVQAVALSNDGDTGIKIIVEDYSKK
jgi:hypothetical protein